MHSSVVPDVKVTDALLVSDPLSMYNMVCLYTDADRIVVGSQRVSVCYTRPICQGGI